jgi:hypothetical protein
LWAIFADTEKHKLLPLLGIAPKSSPVTAIQPIARGGPEKKSG